MIQLLFLVSTAFNISLSLWLSHEIRRMRQATKLVQEAADIILKATPIEP